MYQVSLEGHKTVKKIELHGPTRRHVQFTFEDAADLPAALGIAERYKEHTIEELKKVAEEDLRSSLLGDYEEGDPELERLDDLATVPDDEILDPGEELSWVCLLFQDKAAAIKDGIPEDQITEVWPGKNRNLFRHITHRFETQPS